MYKVQKHIKECQNEVKSNIFNEAFALIHDHAYKHPHDPHDIHLLDDLHHEHDEFDHRNFTLTEKEILKFFEEHDHVGGHPGVGDVISYDHDIGEHEILPAHHDLPLHHPWHHLHKKTDAPRSNVKPNEEFQSAFFNPSPSPSNRNPYQYFNVNPDEANKKMDSERRDFHLFKHLLHKDYDKYHDKYHHHDHDHHDDYHSHHDPHDTIHPTAIDDKDKRIAGVCLDFRFPISDFFVHHQISICLFIFHFFPVFDALPLRER